MKRLNLFKYGLTALMMAFAMTLCYSCSSDDDEEVPEEKKETKEEEKEKDKEKENPSSKVDGTVDGHDYVELAGIKWATVNMGKTEFAEENDNIKNGLGIYYYSYFNARKAAETWGDNWTLPTIKQWETLVDSCKWIWKTNFGDEEMVGYMVSDKNDSTKFIFLPSHYLSNGLNAYYSRNGHYWAADYVYLMNFDRESKPYWGHAKNPYEGLAVRLIVGKPEPVEETEKENIPPSKVDGQINGHDYVKLAGLKWATENIGAVEGVEAKGSDRTYGYYYVWDNAKKAAESWGGSWTLPSEAQWQKLCDECKFTWRYSYSVGDKRMNGWIVSDKEDASKYIFFPAVGECHVTHGYLRQNETGSYWSADYEKFNNATLYKYFLLSIGNRGINSSTLYAMAVRPVSK